jgi:hypothetical protein
MAAGCRRTGAARAQSKLAEVYASGRATPEDFIYACAWFLLATASLRGIHRQKARFEYARILAFDTGAARNGEAARRRLAPEETR